MAKKKTPPVQAKPVPPAVSITPLGQAILDAILDVVCISPEMGMGFIGWSIGKAVDITAYVAGILGKPNKSVDGGLAHLVATGLLSNDLKNDASGKPVNGKVCINHAGWLAYSRWDGNALGEHCSGHDLDYWHDWDGIDGQPIDFGAPKIDWKHATKPPAVSTYSQPANNGTPEVEDLRKKLADSQTQELALVVVKPPPERILPDPETQTALATLPKPEAIGTADITQGIARAKTYGEAAAKCDRLSAGYAGLGGTYAYYRGEFFTRMKDLLAPKGEWMAWYTQYFGKDEVSRDMRLFAAVSEREGVYALAGLTSHGAHKKYLLPMNPKKPKKPKPETTHGPDESKFLPNPVGQQPKSVAEIALETKPAEFVANFEEQANLLAKHVGLVRPQLYILRRIGQMLERLK